MSWQRRLHREFCAGILRPVIDLPTGLGKTMVMPIWLLARAQQLLDHAPLLPTRLVYVVDRRTVVDQATDVAEKIVCKWRSCEALASLPEPTVSTLRGQHADNREWTADPSRPAIIIGTVDMIGSRLLFSGYRSSYKWRPLDAGLLGQDALLVLDEAHLSEPFAKLIRDIGHGGRFQNGQGSPMRVVCMSATTTGRNANQFQLEDSDLKGDRKSNVIVRRFEANKRLTITMLDSKKTVEAIIDAAVELAEDNSRVVVFVRFPDVAARIADAIPKHGGKKNKPFTNAVAVLTGTMRGLERDELLEKPVMKRFLDGDEKPENRAEKGPAILVSTSAGEVGFDLNADHLVCDAAPLDSIIQRFGRVNRRGDGNATVRVFAVKPEENKKEKKPEHTFDSASAAAMICLSNLPKRQDGTHDASPKAFATLTKPLEALSPKPATVELTDILLDAWSMTTIVEPMPGRPPVAPWLRGIDDEQPQTTIAWRAELDIDGFDQLAIEDIEEWFDAHRILTHETLTLPTSKAADGIIERWNALGEQGQSAVAERPCIVDRAGLRKLVLKDLVDELQRKRINSILNADLILPALFGGIERGKGLLSKDAPDAATPDLLKSPDVADVRGRYRLMREGDEEKALVGADPPNPTRFSRFTLDLPSDGDTRRQLVSLVPKQERSEFGTTKQSLSDHVGLVQKHARDMAQRLAISDDIRQAVELAAAWHDQGKHRDIWQRAVGRKLGEPPLGKSGGSMQRIPGNYRHEFGSLREFIAAQDGKLDTDIFDLAMHLIATHHGRGRPHFPKGGFDPDPLARPSSPQIATDTIRRFARLQRKYGHWRLAWLENLLRCADALASKENGEEET